MNRKYRLSAPHAVAAGFALIILIGAVLLALPAANRDGCPIPFINALFTSTSATCVTGLVVYDTWTQFSFFGQLVILCLIQLGGLGFMTFVILISMTLGKRIGLRERSFLMTAVSSMQLGGVVRLVRHILMGTLIIEGVGAVILSFRFCPLFGISNGIWCGVFHSVSAFCNAGFDIMGFIRPYSSLTGFSGDAAVCLTVAALIVVGGLGFIVWEDLVVHKLHWKKYSLHTRIVLSFTFALILIPAALLLVAENSHTFAGMSGGEKLLAALFHSIAPRTAGFNTVDVASLSESGTFLTMLLMFIGAGSGSTAGGIKVTTFAAVLFSVTAYLKKQNADVNAFNRRLSPELVRRAFSSAAFYLGIAVSGCFLIMMAQNIPLASVLFESLSAIGTVGLSVGITAELIPFSKIIIIALMFTGRVGSLTMFMADENIQYTRRLRNTPEKIVIG